MDEARDKIRWGRANKSRKIEELERVATAYHEAGHAVVQHILPRCGSHPQGHDYSSRTIWWSYL